MFDRQRYKKLALEHLKKRWKIPCITTVIFFAIILVMAFSTKILMNGNFRTLFIIIILGCIGILQMVTSYVHLKLTRTKDNLSMDDILVPLGDNWLKGVLGSLWFFFWTFVWSTLFIIPGIVKAISYSQMFFIMTENPDINVKKSMDLSKIITNGHKMDLFVMWLSFFGWMILSSITHGIGSILLSPYMTTAFANAYTELKLEALRIGTLTPADFN